MTKASRVTVIIPSYNGLDLLKKNLPAVWDCLRHGDELIIVDDASQDQTVAWLQEKYHLSAHSALPEYSLYQGCVNDGGKQVMVQVVYSHLNLRFGAAANLGAALAQSQLLFLVNNDVEPSPDVLSELTKFFVDPKMFAVSCLEIEDQPRADQALQLGGKNRLWFAKGLFTHARAVEFTTGPTAWASGGSAMFSRQKWQELGGFDRLFYPAYWEDIDLSFRAKQRGWRVMFCQTAVVYHHHESTHSQVFSQRQLQKMSWLNGLKFTWRHADRFKRLQFLLWQPYWILQIIRARA